MLARRDRRFRPTLDVLTLRISPTSWPSLDVTQSMVDTSTDSSCTQITSPTTLLLQPTDATDISPPVESL